MNIKDCITATADKLANSEAFFGHGTDNPIDEAAYLILEGLEIGFDDNLDYERELNKDEMERLEVLIRQRVEDLKPVAYIVGRAWFAGHPFYCDERALVPRSPIAELIGNHFEPLLVRAPARILDLCTGGGSIGIASALAFPKATVELADISLDALALANENIVLHQLEGRAAAIHSNLFAGIDGKFDLIVSNPPYVARDEVDALPNEYSHEPELGLLSEDDGLAIPLEILRNAADYLKEDGVLVMEVGFNHDILAERLKDVPLLWLEFEFGGEGVFSLTTSELRQYRDAFN
ncbi:MAG: 50S ribosomal protein L3 N(5)-glutamine methyltransferase [Gammaproteobacteria bacterium]|nr:50S ribosomal protein L3 N(5)-glutamine methyltransferase [Gammaproteobacteria bacterium]MBT3858731.1 50S ribosomal protein L3 N(5)-glutamine methyltransferase [Gammaproteobacteria bacterium]MBT3986083.1 50S ribosomal protein L3 N(5)-glutamine methyltransferase [Gammaproteobacteria bacterium]MBT4580794.1 50S ribosomal protein L3 N(5)-glutamine methyltransferase [Gammaproteobacteria bacterium]MBT4659007.1 50S ribosomal protein L3 N(5)-glutamine methyltransferase [Gammaproteobacteria bacterium